MTNTNDYAARELRAIARYITPTAAACGVTPEDVKRYAARAMVRDGVAIVDDVAPALAQSVARWRLGAENVEFLGFSVTLGLQRYRRA